MIEYPTNVCTACGEDALDGIWFWDRTGTYILVAIRFCNWLCIPALWRKGYTRANPQ